MQQGVLFFNKSRYTTISQLVYNKVMSKHQKNKNKIKKVMSMLPLCKNDTVLITTCHL